MRLLLMAPVVALLIACGGGNETPGVEPTLDPTVDALLDEVFQDDCDPSYPGVCIPSPPPDLNCGQIDERRFEVIGDDPHGFDADFDGIGCELD